MKILFVDPCCPKPYTTDSLKDTPMGGTEATCARLMRELQKQDKVTMCQMRRDKYEVDSLSIEYINYIDTADNPDVVVTLRDGKTFRVMNERYPKAKHYLWMHDVVGGAYKEHLVQTLSGFPTHFVCGSYWHKMQIINEFESEFISHNFKIEQISNFVEDYCTVTSREYDPYKLVFFSSPHKGLHRVCDLFRELRKVEPKYHLSISNPGYFPDAQGLPEGVTNLGILQHKEAIDQVRGALCLFYPNNTSPETFGLVYAEANAVGVPVLCHDIGAAKEVISTPQQTVGQSVEEVIKTVQAWTSGDRPVVKVKEQYTIKEAIREWRKFLNPMRLIK